jgi:rod shape-determining protein MreC
MNETGFLFKRRRGLTLLAALFLSLLILVVDTKSFTINPAQFGYSVLSTFQIGFAGVKNFFRETANSITELRRLKSEYEALREKMEDYQLIQRDIVNLRSENERLRTLLELTEELEYRHIPSRIIAKDPSGYFHSFTINKGSRDGISKDMPVIAYQQGFQGVVGKILEVGPFTSRVLPLISANCYVSSRLQNSRFEGLVQGGGGINHPIVMRYVVKAAREEIQFGDLVETSGLDSIYPPDIFIGRVRSIGSKEWEPDLELSIEPIIDFSRLEYVVVLDIQTLSTGDTPE